MKHTRIAGLVLGAAALFAPLAASAQSVGETEELVVDFDDGASEGEIAEVARSLGLTLTPNSFLASEDRLYRTTVPAERANDVLHQLNANPRVEGADENIEMRALFVPNDPMLPQQWGMRRVGGPAAWDVSCGRGVTVAVIDTGVACENYGEFTRVPDLAGTRCAQGYNFVNRSVHANDDHGHGTHVAGTIAQTTNNRLGTAGVAYCATILPVKVLDGNGRGTLANVAEGIRWAADHGAQVLNLSLGGGGRSRVLDNAVKYARDHGAVVVCAAGNSGRAVESPANAPGAVAVSAIDSSDQIAYFSSRGPEIAVAAPGVGILQQTICDHGRNRCEQFASWSGTSMAAPHAAGVAALIFSMGVTDPAAVEAALRGTASKPSHGGQNAELYGAGIASAANASTEILWRHGITRLAALAVLALGLAAHIKRKKGTLTFGWLLPALATGVGFFALPSLLPHTFPGADFLIHPVADWDTLLFGVSAHKWLLFANAGVALAGVALAFGRRGLRSLVGGVALGSAAYLVAAVWLGETSGPFGALLLKGWAVANALVCLWVARIGIDATKADPEPPPPAPPPASPTN